MSSSPPRRGKPTWADKSFRSLLEAAPDAMLVVDRAGEIVLANLQAEKLFGYGCDELIGRSVESLIPPRFRTEHPQYRAEYFGAPRVRPMGASVELFALCEDGTEVPVEISLSPLTNEAGTFIVSAIRDATDRRRLEQLKRAEGALRKSEEKFRRVVEHIGDALFVDNVEGQVVFANERFLNLFGFSREELPDIRLEDYVAPEYRATLRDRHDRRVRGEAVPTHFEYEGFRRDGKRMWLEVDVVPVTDENGNLIGTQSALREITERKRAEEALLEVNRRLIEAQEQERARIGRELHDDINQRLAMLAIELERLQDSPSEVRSGLQELRKQTTELSSDVQALSHELHSSKLDYLGAVGGIKSWCNEFGERQGIQIEVKTPESKISLRPEVGLCLFRVLQEALHNAAKHSGVKRIEVQLREDSGEIHLIIRDSGKGFDLDTAMQGRGLGLTSMEERVRLVNGMIEIQSKPMGGTTVHVRVPLGSEHSSQRAAG